MTRNMFRPRFWTDARGVAAVEFAFIAPVMILLFFGVVEGSSALTESRKAMQAVNTLADLASQETQLTPTDISDLFDGVSQIIGRDGGVTDIRLISLVYDATDQRVEVRWSRDNTGAAPYAPGAAYPGLTDPALFAGGASLMLAEVKYDWTPTLTRQLIHGVAFDKVATRWPRRSPRVELCVSPGNCAS